jgi:hypothetical protein
MPIQFLSAVVSHSAEKPIPPRRRGFNRKVAELAPIIAKLQKAQFLNVQEIADELNRLGVAAPGGGDFSFGTTYRVLIRGAELNLCSGPLKLDQAKQHTQRKKDALVAKVLEKFRK